MKKLIAFLLKTIACPFLVVGILLIITAATIKNGWDKTEAKLDEINEKLSND